MNQDKKTTLISLNNRLWRSFILYGIILVSILWLLQHVFLDSFYRRMKIREVDKISAEITELYGMDTFEEELYRQSLRRGIIIQVMNKDGTLLFPLSFFDVIQPPKLASDKWQQMMRDLREHPEGVHYEHYRDELEALTVSNFTYLGNDLYLYITSILEPIDATADILKEQLLWVSVFVVILSLAISYGLSRRLSRPIEDLKLAASQLAHGDVSVTFESEGYREIKELAHYLNLAKDELAHSLEFRKDLIGNVSHDLKTPLTVIKSYAEMIKDISGDNKDKRDKDLEVIIDEADHLTFLVNEILDLSKVESGLDTIHLEKVDMVEIVEKVLSRLTPILENTYHLEKDLPPSAMLYADALQMEQVFYNLINNAINYTGEDGYIGVSIEQQDGRIRFLVADSGAGVSDEDKTKIWERYVASGKGHHRQSVGSGLGLYIVRSILQLHQFDYGVFDRDIGGSIFYFEAPLLYDDRKEIKG